PLFSCGKFLKRMDTSSSTCARTRSKRPFACACCAKHFSRSDNLNQHMCIYAHTDVGWGNALGLG
ncbi:hypothetical protein DENSPDRAFT_789326, partial [Dentipellis sp. KUC8613]